MTSQGQRFRRRALRRGYKVDEVDAFLDRVEATLAGELIDAPVTPQEVHDVVFRVRFGGYDEWQVDLHLDRVERQLAEHATQPGGPAFGRGPDPRMGGHPDHMPPMGGHPDQPPPMGPPDRGPMERMGPPPDRMGPPGPGPGPAPMAPHSPARSAPSPGPGAFHEPPPASSGPPYRPDYAAQYDEPTYGGGFDGRDAGRRGLPPGPGGGGWPGGGDRMSDMTSEMRFDEPPGGRFEEPSGGRFEEPPGGRFEEPPGGRMARPEPSDYGPGPGPRGPAGPPPGMVGPGSPAPPPPPPMSGHVPAPMGGPAGGDLQRVDELRRGFQPRRFGSGYDRAQVDRLFEEVLAGMSGHGPMPASEADLDPRRFDLVPGGYFEAEVEAALDELRSMLRRL